MTFLHDIPGVKGKDVVILTKRSLGRTWDGNPFFVQVNESGVFNLEPTDALYFEGSAVSCSRCVVSSFLQIPAFVMLDPQKPKSQLLREYCEKHGVPHIKEIWNRRETPLAWLKALGARLECAALTGMIALEHLRLHDVRSIFVTGFTFYHDGTRFPERTGSHWILPQVDYLRHLLETDMRISVDAELERLL